ncbi:MAG: hypothetical protein AB7H97_18645, partial [Pseudobdellovibrionaceae bacterium]
MSALKQQRDFRIDAKMEIVRQDRIDCDPERYSLQLPDTKIRVVNFSPFGVAVECSNDLKEEYTDVLFLVDNYPISEVSLKKVRNHTSHEGRNIVAFAIVGSSLDVDAALTLKALNESLDKNTETFVQSQTLNEEFRLATLEVKSVLSNLQEAVNSFAKSSFTSDISSLLHFEDRITGRVSQYFKQSLNPIYGKIETILKKVSATELPQYFEYFRQNVGEIMYQSAYAHRAYTKPKGYAGDFEMMNHVYKRELRGDSLFAKCLQRYFVDEPAGRAV